jgi:hypothetical protein
MKKIDRNKTYYDVTHQYELHPDDRHVAKINYVKILGCWVPDIYDYILTDEELARGICEGWAMVRDPLKKLIRSSKCARINSSKYQNRKLNGFTP